jgi:C-terminal processing protease CtpA/Prc
MRNRIAYIVFFLFFVSGISNAQYGTYSWEKQLNRYAFRSLNAVARANAESLLVVHYYKKVDFDPESGQPLIDGKPSFFDPFTFILHGKNYESWNYRLHQDTTTISEVRMLPTYKEVGYIKVKSFSDSTAGDLLRSLKKLMSQGMDKLIIDLRQTSGGPGQAALEFADCFLRGGVRVYYIKDRSGAYHGVKNTTYKADKYYLPIIVLIDRGSSSATEIVAGCFQEFERALLIGETTYGKGLCQVTNKIDDSTALVFTKYKWFLDSGRNIQIPFSEFFSGDLDRNSENFFTGKPVFISDSGRQFFGNSGIRPDIFVLKNQDILQLAIENFGRAERLALSHFNNVVIK